MTALGALARTSASPVQRLVGALVLALALFGWLGHAAPQATGIDVSVPTLALTENADPVDRIKSPVKVASEPVSDNPDLLAREPFQQALFAPDWTIAAAIASQPSPAAHFAPNQPRAPPFP